MKRIFWILTGLALLLDAPESRAQTDDKPVPKAPYLAPVPDYGHWIVTFKYDGATDSTSADDNTAAAKPSLVPDGFPTAIDTIKTGNLRGIVFTASDGTTRQFTCQGDWVLSSTPKGPQLLVASLSQRPYTYYTSGFILLDGVTVNPSTFKGAEMYKGNLAFHYQSSDVEVWIDINSMLPLMVKRSGAEASYQFLPAPPRPFVIPDDQANLLQKEQDADQRARTLR